MPAKFDTNVEWAEEIFQVIGNKFNSMTLESGKEVRSNVFARKKVWSNVFFLELSHSSCFSTQEITGKKIGHMICTLKLAKFFSSSLYYFPPCVAFFILMFYSCSVHFVILIIVLISCLCPCVIPFLFYSFRFIFPIIPHLVVPFFESTSNLIVFFIAIY